MNLKQDKVLWVFKLNSLMAECYTNIMRIGTANYGKADS